MIEKGLIKSQLEDILKGSDVFTVEVKVDNKNKILVHLDRMEGISIDDCVRISRELESRLDRDTEDFALEVSSPGLDAPFRVPQQYEKSLGKKVEVILEDGTKEIGTLKELKGDGFVLEISQAKKENRQEELRYTEVKSTRIHIEF